MQMSRLELSDIAKAIPRFSLEELLALEMSVQVAIQMHNATRLSTDKPFADRNEDEGPGLSDLAIEVLSDLDHVELSLPDQALLASVILDGGFEQVSFSSREIHEVIQAHGRPRIQHITSAISPLTSRSYFINTTNKLYQLSTEGKAKARGLISMKMRERDDAA